MSEIITPGRHETLPCRFCHAPLEIGEGMVCRFCKGLETKLEVNHTKSLNVDLIPSGPDEPEIPEEADLEETLRVCDVCGEEFDEYKNGSQTVKRGIVSGARPHFTARKPFKVSLQVVFRSPESHR